MSNKNEVLIGIAGEFPIRIKLKTGETRTIKELIVDEFLNVDQRYFVNGIEVGMNHSVKNGDIVAGISPVR